jgi:Xaa-Pro aminopeptidase
VVPYPDAYVGSDTLHPMEFVADRLHDMGLGSCAIGVEADDYYYTARWDHILRARLPEADFRDAFLLVNRCRMVKSPREIDYMREAGTIAAAAQRAAFAAMAPGVRQCDVMAEVYRVTTAGTEEHGGTFPCKPPNAMVGERCSAPHLSWTDEKLAEGDLFYIELGGIRHRYHSPLSRCHHLGPAPAELRRLAEVIAEGLEAVLGTVRAGRTCHDLAVAWQGVIRRHGVEKDSRIGYPVGIGFPPTWGELTASIREGDETVLEAGMTFHCIPAIWLETTGVVISETFAVTETGADVFAECPRELFVRH